MKRKMIATAIATIATLATLSACSRGKTNGTEGTLPEYNVSRTLNDDQTPVPLPEIEDEKGDTHGDMPQPTPNNGQTPPDKTPRRRHKKHKLPPRGGHKPKPTIPTPTR